MGAGLARRRIKEPRIVVPDTVSVSQSRLEDPDTLLKLCEVAGLLRYTSTQSIRDLIHSGDLVAVDVGVARPGRKRITCRVRVADVRAFIRERTLSATGAEHSR